jgi:glycosyltransferase involved in cell wall biosynthesis
MINKSKKLLIIIPIFPKDAKEDTIVPFLAQFFDYFSRQYAHLEIHICTLYYPHKKTKYLYNNMVVHSLGRGFQSKIKGFFTVLKDFFELSKLQREYQFDAMLSVWYLKPALLGKLMHFFYKIPYIVWLQGQDVQKNNKYLKYLSFKNEHLLVVGENHKKILEANFKNKKISIANVAIIPSGFPELNTSFRKYDVIGVGNLSTLKNFSFFIDIIYELKKTNQNINAIICGDGEEKGGLERKIINLELSDNIKLMGYVTNKEVRKLLNNGKTYLHTSHFEGNSFSIQEALYSGCKVVSTIPLGSVFENFYSSATKIEIIQKINEYLKKSEKECKRITAYRVRYTAEVVYDLLFKSNC